ncbi:hypothetical protein AB0L80_41560 [Streptomyces sp. NPDC052069]|uniref:hypothetical protein n=1 Tax=Streptomyces sp. NPDC052069 TaxID=3154650 RepID=UPI0034248602
MPVDTDRGFWPAADHCPGGALVRDFGAEHLVIGAPACGSWMCAGRVGPQAWSVTAQGPRDIWTELQDLAVRWRAADSPGRYHLDFGPDGAQRAVSACGGLSWQLPDPHPFRERAAP